MSVPSVLLIVAAIVYGFLAIHHITGYRNLTTDRENHTFGVLMALFALYAAAGLFWTHGSTATHMAWGLRLRTALLGPISGTVFLFCVQLGKVTRHRSLPGFEDGNWVPTIRIQQLWYGLTPLPGLLGLANHSASSVQQFAPARPHFPAEYFLPQLTALGTLTMGLFVAVPILGVVLLSFHAHRKLHFALRLSAGLSIAVSIHDFLLLHGAVHSVFLLEFVGVLASLVFTNVRLDGIVATGAALEIRQQQLKIAYREQRRTERQLIEQRKLSAVGELAAAVAHTFRNPLAVIRSAATRMKRVDQTDPSSDTMNRVLNEEVQRLSRLAGDLGRFADPTVAHAEKTPAMVLAQGAVDLVSNVRNLKNIHVLLDPELEQLQLEGDADLLRHAVANVVDNAALACGEQGRISIAPMGGARGLVITDTGVGMDEITTNQAMDPFFTTRSDGAGLGLAIAERVIRSHGGEIHITSTPGQGTTVSLTLSRRPNQNVDTIGSSPHPHPQNSLKAILEAAQ